MIIAIGYLFIILAVGHAITGVVLYKPAYTALFKGGFINAVIPHMNRALFFWFMMFSALMLLLGQLILHAAATADQSILKMAAWYALVVGLIGALAMPKSPFWFAVLSSPFLLQAAYTE